MKHSERKKPSFLFPSSFGLDLLPAVREGIFYICHHCTEDTSYPSNSSWAALRGVGFTLAVLNDKYKK